MQFSDLYKCEKDKVILFFSSFAGFGSSLLFDRMVPTKIVFSASKFLASGMLVKKLSVVKVRNSATVIVHSFYKTRCASVSVQSFTYSVLCLSIINSKALVTQQRHNIFLSIASRPCDILEYHTIRTFYP